MFLLAIDAQAKADEIEALYKYHGVNGSLLIESLDQTSRVQYNLSDKDRYIPASTFKIPNTLILLEEGLINGSLETIRWDGQKRSYAAWNKDHTLESAFKVSCVWCYQRYAIQIGDKKYLEYLEKFEYGNRLTGPNLSSFWLNGDLKTTVKDQVSFLKKVYSEDLPVQSKNIRILKNIMCEEGHDGVKIWAKTGWSGRSGWYVGYLEADDTTWFFANHIEISGTDDLVLRKKLVVDSLRLLNIIQ
jgi:beta-lactamase class D